MPGLDAYDGVTFVFNCHSCLTSNLEQINENSKLVRIGSEVLNTLECQLDCLIAYIMT